MLTTSIDSGQTLTGYSCPDVISKGESRMISEEYRCDQITILIVCIHTDRP